MSFWNKQTFCLITGASKGIGKTLAIEFSKKVGQNSEFLLIARSGQALEETKAEILSSGIQPIQVITAALDLGNPVASEYLTLINSALTSTGTEANDFEHIILVHNAASLGNIQLRTVELENLEELRTYYDFNLYSLILLNTQFFKVFSNSKKQRSVVHITSRGVRIPFKTWGAYCAGKAARDMIMKCIAVEEPSISTISYGPGMVDTDIYTQAMTDTGDLLTKNHFTDSKASGILTPLQTVTRLIRVLDEGKFTKGEHVEYTDFNF